jgi:hypothetical protein
MIDKLMKHLLDQVFDVGRIWWKGWGQGPWYDNFAQETWSILVILKSVIMFAG